MHTPPTKPAQAGGAFPFGEASHYHLHCRQLNLKSREKEQFRQLVENKPRVSRKSGEKPYFYSSLYRSYTYRNYCVSTYHNFRFKKTENITCIHRLQLVSSSLFITFHFFVQKRVVWNQPFYFWCSFG